MGWTNIFGLKSTPKSISGVSILKLEIDVWWLKIGVGICSVFIIGVGKIFNFISDSAIPKTFVAVILKIGFSFGLTTISLLAFTIPISWFISIFSAPSTSQLRFISIPEIIVSLSDLK